MFRYRDVSGHHMSSTLAQEGLPDIHTAIAHL